MAWKAGHWRGAAVALASIACLLPLESVALASEVSNTCAYQDPDRGDRELALDVDTVAVSRSESDVITFTVGFIENERGPAPGFEIRIDTDSDRDTGDANGAEILLTHAEGDSDPNPGLSIWRQGTWEATASPTLQFESGQEKVTFRIGTDELPNAAFAFQAAAGGRWLRDDYEGIDVAPTRNTESMWVIATPDQWAFPNCRVIPSASFGEAWDEVWNDLEGGGYVYVLGALLVAVVGAAIAVAGWMIDRSRKPNR